MSTVRRFLVPDLEGELVAATEPVEEFLLSAADWATDDPAIRLPPALRRPAAEAVGELRLAIVRAQFRPLCGPDGWYEHVALAVVSVPEVIVTNFGDAVAAMARHDGDVDELLDEFCADYPTRFTAQRLTAQQLAETAARFHGVCDLAWGDDQDLLAARLQTAPTDADPVVLTVAEEAAYRRVRDRLVAMWHDFSQLERWVY
jgi:hypothetical protein